MDFKEGFKEFGKALINIGVAAIIFAIIQPFVKGEFSAKLGIIALIMFLSLSGVGILLISLGGKENDNWRIYDTFNGCSFYRRVNIVFYRSKVGRKTEKNIISKEIT